MTNVVIGVLVVWFVVIVANQVGAIRGRFPRLTKLKILPFMSLFAPEPVDIDYHVVWRDIDGEGTLGPWHELPFEPVRLPWRAFSNPWLRDRTTLLEVVQDLMLLSDATSSSRMGPRLALVSFPYLFLLHVVTRQPREATSAARQFIVIETSGFDDTRRVELCVASEAHALQ